MSATNAAALRKRLGQLVSERRLQMGVAQGAGLSQAKAAELAGVTVKTWARVESGGAAWPITYAKIEALVGYEPGAIKSFLDGGDEPAPAEELPVRLRRTSQTSTWRPEVAADLRTAIRDAVITAAPDVTGAQIQEIQRRIEADLRSGGVLPPMDDVED